MANILPSATVSVILREALLFPDTDADLSLKTKGPHADSQALISASKGGFPFQNFWQVNMSPGWKTIQLSPGRLFSNCCSSVCDPFLPPTQTHARAHTHNGEGSSCTGVVYPKHAGHERFDLSPLWLKIFSSRVEFLRK